MALALVTAGGKDATLALHRARAAGRDVRLGLCFHDRETERIAFHGTPVALVRDHLEALGLDPVLVPVPPGDFEGAFREALRALVARGVDGVVFGNIHLDDVRAWYEERVGEAGLEHVEPLWGDDPAALVEELIDLGYLARVVSVDTGAGDAAWLGRDLDADLAEAIVARGADPCGERGEYHTFVHDGPAFAWSVAFENGDVVEKEGHRLVDLVLPPPGP